MYFRFSNIVRIKKQRFKSVISLLLILSMVISPYAYVRVKAGTTKDMAKEISVTDAKVESGGG